jgi:hypothetical protein
LDHLDFAMTKPRAREAFVANVMGVDVIGLTIFFVTSVLALALLHVAAGETHGIVLDGASWFGFVLAYGSVLAWYAIVQAVSCGRGASGWAVAGVWGAALGLEILSAVNIGPGLHAIVVVLNLFNPISYLVLVPFVATGAATPDLAAHAIGIYFVAGLAALVALNRWQRVEA